MSIPLLQWQPTREGYLRFLVESKLVYDALEQIVQQASVPECKFAAQCTKMFCAALRNRYRIRCMVQGLRVGSKCWTQSYMHLLIWTAAREALLKVQRLVPSYSSVSCKKSSYVRTVAISYTLDYTTSMHTKNFEIHLWETPCPFYTYLCRYLAFFTGANICTSTCIKGMVSPTDEFWSS